MPHWSRPAGAASRSAGGSLPTVRFHQSGNANSDPSDDKDGCALRRTVSRPAGSAVLAGAGVPTSTGSAPNPKARHRSAIARPVRRGGRAFRAAVPRRSQRPPRAHTVIGRLAPDAYKSCCPPVPDPRAAAAPAADCDREFLNRAEDRRPDVGARLEARPPRFGSVWREACARTSSRPATTGSGPQISMTIGSGTPGGRDDQHHAATAPAADEAMCGATMPDATVCPSAGDAWRTRSKAIVPRVAAREGENSCPTATPGFGAFTPVSAIVRRDRRIREERQSPGSPRQGRGSRYR